MSTALFTKEKYQFIPMENPVYRILKLCSTRFIIILKPYLLKSALNVPIKCIILFVCIYVYSIIWIVLDLLS